MEQVEEGEVVPARAAHTEEEEEEEVGDEDEGESAGTVLIFVSLSWGKTCDVPFGVVCVYLIKLGTCVPCGTGPLVGRTKRPLEFWTLSLRKMDT